ncbi:MAG: hypothetical protein ACOCP8_00250 [archaeon]
MNSRLKKIANLENKYLDLSEKLWEALVHNKLSKLKGNFDSDYTPGSRRIMYDSNGTGDPGENEMLKLTGNVSFVLTKNNVENILNKKFSNEEWEEFGLFNREEFDHLVVNIDDFEHCFDVDLKEIILDFAGENPLDEFESDLDFDLNYDDHEIWIEIEGTLFYYGDIPR